MTRIRIVLVSLVLTACASPAASPVTGTTPPPRTEHTEDPTPDTITDVHAEGTLRVIPAAIADGPGIDIPDALAAAPASEMLVNGWLVIGVDGVVWLCESLTDASPPTCAGDRLRVEGYPTQLADDVEEADGVRWYPHSIQVLGDVSIP